MQKTDTERYANRTYVETHHPEFVCQVMRAKAAGDSVALSPTHGQYEKLRQYAEAAGVVTENSDG